MNNLRFFLEDSCPYGSSLWKRLKAWCARAIQRGRARSIEEVFTGIYKRNEWRGSESRSGEASSLVNTTALRAALPVLNEQFGVRSLLDIPCGDFHWVKEVPMKLDRYIGADIVDELVARNRKYESEVRSFVKLDITSDSLPRVDLVLCRDCLIHFSFEDIFSAIENIKASGSRYLFTTTFTRSSRLNVDIATGQWQPLNLQQPPFGFPQPLVVINEKFSSGGGRYADRSLALWRIAVL